MHSAILSACHSGVVGDGPAIVVTGLHVGWIRPHAHGGLVIVVVAQRYHVTMRFPPGVLVVVVALLACWCNVAAATSDEEAQGGRLHTATYEGMDLRVTAEHSAMLEAVLASHQVKPIAAAARAAPRAAGTVKASTTRAAVPPPVATHAPTAKVAPSVVAGKVGSISPSDYPNLWVAYKAKNHKVYTAAQDKIRYAALLRAHLVRRRK